MSSTTTQANTNSTLKNIIGLKLDSTQDLLYCLQKRKSRIRPFTAQPRKDSQYKVFECQIIPKISFVSFIERFSLLGEISDESFIHAFILFEKALSKDKDLKRPSCTHKLFTACVFVSEKLLLDEEFWKLEDFCKLGGINKDQLEMLEMKLLNDILEFEIFVKEEIFYEMKDYLGRFYQFEIQMKNSIGRSLIEEKKF